MPVASAISTHPVQASHHPAVKGIGVRGRGDGSGPDFGEVLRGQAGVISQQGEGTAKQGSVPVSGKTAGETSDRTNGAAEQIKEAMKAKAAAGRMNSPSAQLQALSKSGAQAADAEGLQGAANAADSKEIKKDDNAKFSLPGADAGDGKAVKDKSGKDGKADKADKTIAAQTSVEKPPQVPIQSAALAVPAAVPAPAPVLPALPEKPKAGSVVPTRSATPPAAKSVPARQEEHAAKGTAGTTGKTQGAPGGAELPTPDASPTPEGAQDAAGDLTGDADSEKFSAVKSAGKQDAAAIAAKADSGASPQAKHLNSPVPAAVHSAQAAQAVVGGPGENAAQISASPQNLAGVSSPAVGALHGASVGAASPYDRIDQGAAPVVLHAGAQQVAVGVHDPSLGWVEIKTQSAAGHVDATLVASSGQTHDALAAQLPAISQFLEQRDVRVGTLVVNHQSAGSGANHSGNGSGQHAGPGYGGNAGSGGNSGNSGGERRGPQYSTPVPARHSVPVTGAGGDSGSARPLSYISVRA